MEKTVFLSITNAEKEAHIAAAIIGRENEIFSYEINIENYERILSNPDTPPGTRARLNALVVSEYAERQISLDVYGALKALIAPGALAAAVATAKAKIAPV